MTALRTRGPWRAVCFLLLALVLVQADAHPLDASLRGFVESRLLPAARLARARIEVQLVRLSSHWTQPSTPALEPVPAPAPPGLEPEVDPEPPSGQLTL